MFQQYRQQAESQLRPGAELSDIADWGNRLPGTVARHAGILHMLKHAVDESRRPWDEQTSRVTMEAAIRLAEYFTAHAQVAFGMMGADQKLRKSKETWESIGRQDYEQFTERELWQKIRRRFKRKTELTEALQILTEMNYVRPMPTAHEGPGRKPSPVYLVNPIARTQNTHNTPNATGPDDSVDSVDIVYRGEGSEMETVPWSRPQS